MQMLSTSVVAYMLFLANTVSSSQLTTVCFGSRQRKNRTEKSVFYTRCLFPDESRARFVRMSLSSPRHFFKVKSFRRLVDLSGANFLNKVEGFQEKIMFTSFQKLQVSLQFLEWKEKCWQH